jgi:general secretion pathway protein F
MPRFFYKAVSAAGEVLEGELDAQDRHSVINRLRDQGHVPLRVEEDKASLKSGFSLDLGGRSRRVRLKDLVILTREIATLLQAGLPLDQALATVQDLTRARPVRDLVGRILDQVRGGSSLANALEAQGGLFPNYYIGMVRAGEAGGSLDQVYEQLSETLARQAKLRESVRSALQYPTLVLAVALLSVIILLTEVIPEFKPLFVDAEATLPWSTRAIIALSDWLRAYWWALLLVFALAALTIARRLRHPAFRERWDAWALRVPLFGDIVRKAETARFGRTLGILLQNGVTLLNGLAMTADALNNHVIAQTLREVQGKLRKGEGLARPLFAAGVFPPVAIQLLRVGEESGQLEIMLLRVAEIYDDEVKRSLERFVSLLVPLITIALGVLVAVIIGSILSAILGSYDLPI